MRSPSLLAFGLGSVVLAAALTATSAPVSAQTTQFVPCSGDNGGPDGLIQAIIVAQSGGGSGLIQLAPGCTYTFTSPIGVTDTALPIITGRVAITGKDAVIARPDNAAASFRLFQVGPGGYLALTGVTVRGGRADSGGGILNQGTLSLKSSTLTANTALDSGGGFAGTTGSLTLLYHSTVYNNTATANGGGGYTSDSTLRSVASNFDGNSAVSGGGLYLEGASKLVESGVERNWALGDGGGIYLAGGNLQVRTTKIAHNTAARGGGLFVQLGSAELVRSKVVGNLARVSGGGIFNEANVNLDHTTVAGNEPNNCAGGSLVPGCGNGVKADDRHGKAEDRHGPWQGGHAVKGAEINTGAKAMEVRDAKRPRTAKRSTSKAAAKR